MNNKEILIILLVIILVIMFFTKTHEKFLSYTPTDVSGFTTFFANDGLSRDLNHLTRNSGESLNDFLGRCKSRCAGSVCKGFITDFDPNNSNPDDGITQCWIKGTNADPLSTLTTNSNRISYIKN